MTSRREGGAPTRDAPATTTGGAATDALLLTVVAMLVARAVAAVTPGTWMWSLDLNRFLSPVMGWGLWGAAALLALPPVARALAPWTTRAGDAIGRGDRVVMIAAALLAALLAWSMPDRVRFVGDFLLRQGTVEIAEKPALLFPQALPLDVFLHVTLPSWLIDHGLANANGAARALGLVEVVLFAALALGLARSLDRRGAAAFAATTVMFFGGYLGMFTGFGKAFTELCVLVAWTGVGGLGLIRRGRGAFALGLAIAIAATLHRSGLGLVPAAAFAWIVAWRRHAVEPRIRRALLTALVVPVITLAVMVPRIVAVVRRWDAVHFHPQQVERQGGVLASALAGGRGADILDLMVMLSPLVATLVTVLPLVLATRSGAPAPEPATRRGARGPRPVIETTPSWGAEVVFLALLALPFTAMMPFIHPAQGMFRDWDDFCATGVALSLLVAWTLSAALRARPDRAWLAVSVAAAVAVPSVQWLEVQRDLGHGLERVHAFMVGPPRRSDEERGKTWDYLGIRHFRLGNEASNAHRDEDARREYARAAEAFTHAAETAPSPRILQQWALACNLSGDDLTARDVYHRLLEKDPGNAYAWLSLAEVEMNLHDFAAAKTAGERVLALEPGNGDARQLLHDIELIESGQAHMP
ncbi:MAG: tetratricopeptide repeat protein [Candidatus Eisenbacteria bacterium]